MPLSSPYTRHDKFAELARAQRPCPTMSGLIAKAASRDQILICVRATIGPGFHVFRSTADMSHSVRGNSRSEKVIRDVGQPHRDLAIETLAVLRLERAGALIFKRVRHTRLLIGLRSPVVPIGNSSGSARRAVTAPKHGPVFRDRNSCISQMQRGQQFAVKNIHDLVKPIDRSRSVAVARHSTTPPAASRQKEILVV